MASEAEASLDLEVAGAVDGAFRALGVGAGRKSLAVSDALPGQVERVDDDELPPGVREALMLLSVSQTHLEEGSAEEAMEGAEEALLLLEGVNGESKSELEAWRIMTNVHLLKGDPAAAVRSAVDGQRALAQAGDTHAEATMLLALAEAHLQQEEVEPALRAAQEAQELFLKLKDGGMEGKAWAVISHIHAARRAPADAADAASQAVELCTGAGLRRAEAEAWERLAQAHWLSGDRIDAREAAEEALSAYRDSGDVRGEAGVLCNLSEELLRLGRAREALQKAKEAMKKCEASSHDREQVQALSLAAQAHFVAGQADEALDLTEDCIEELRRRKTHSRLALAESLSVLTQVTSTAAGMLGLRSLANRAHSVALEAVDICKGLGHKRLVLAALHNLAKAQLALWDAHGAQASLQEALDMSRQSEYISGEALTLYTLSEVQLQHGNVDEALRCCSESQVLFESVGDKGMLAEALVQAASVNCAIGAFTEALSHITEAREVKEQMGDKKGACSVLLMSAELFARSGAQDHAFRMAKQAWEALQNTSEWTLQIDALRSLGIAHMAKGELHAALTLAEKGFERFRRVDSLLGQARMSLLAAQAKFNIFARVVEEGGAAVAQNATSSRPARRMYTDAADAVSEAVALARKAGDRFSLADGLYLQGQVLGICDDLKTLEAGRRAAHESALVNQRCGRSREEAHALVIVGEICARLGDRGAAKEAALQAQAIYERGGLPGTRFLSKEKEQGMAVVENLLIDRPVEVPTPVVVVEKEKEVDKSASSPEHVPIEAKHQAAAVAS